MQCTLMPSDYKGAESICISEVTEGSQELTVLEAQASLTENELQKHPIVTGLEAPCILPQVRVLQGPKRVPVSSWYSCLE